MSAVATAGVDNGRWPAAGQSIRKKRSDLNAKLKASLTFNGEARRFGAIPAGRVAVKQEPEPTADDANFARTMDEQVRRLRRMLVLMAPDAGSSALGARRNGFPPTPLDDRLPALKDRGH